MRNERRIGLSRAVENIVRNTILVPISYAEQLRKDGHIQVGGAGDGLRFMGFLATTVLAPTTLLWTKTMSENPQLASQLEDFARSCVLIAGKL